MYRVKVFFIAIFFVHVLGACEFYLSLFENKKVLITGGTGFLGRALTKEILKYNPHSVIIFSRDEVKHHTFCEQINDDRVHSIIGDVRQYESIERAVNGVDVVIHAAALKRIDALEYHVCESIYTNIVGTLNVAQACARHKVEKTLLISTDKACAPVNTYGGCKFIAEKIFSNFAPRGDESKFLVVRYGNVLESTGSVIPYFCEKIKNNQEIPLTDENMSRFFITKGQALDLIFKALSYGQGGEVFVPCLPSFTIVDLIEVLKKRFDKYPLTKLIGLRPGEKIHEIMINNTEVTRAYRFKDMFVIIPTIKQTSHRTRYMTDDTLLKDNRVEYSSADSIVSLEILDQLLQENGI